MNKKQKIINLIMAGFLTLMGQSQLHGASSVGKVFELFGKKEELKYTRQAQTGSLGVNAPLYYNDGILTGSNSSTRLLVEDPASKIKAAFYVFEDSKFTLDKEVVEAGGKKIIVKHTQGALSFFVKGLKKSDELQIVTPHATLGVRGTAGQIEVTEKATWVWVYDGVLHHISAGEKEMDLLHQGWGYKIVDGQIKEEIPDMLPGTRRKGLTHIGNIVAVGTGEVDLDLPSWDLINILDSAMSAANDLRDILDH